MTSDLSELRGRRLVLRRPVPEDVETRLSIGQHREIVEAYGGTFEPGTAFTRAHAEAALRFIETQDHAWIIDAGGFIGHIRFHSLAPADRRAALAIGIEHPDYLGRGFGAEAIRLALAYMFERGLHRISLRVLASNARAIACYRKCGFVEEGRERETAFVGGAWRDDLIMGILDREFVSR